MLVLAASAFSGPAPGVRPDRPGAAEFAPNTTGPERNNVMPNLHYEVLLDDACAHPRPAPFGR
jgi:hypothetical protein